MWRPVLTETYRDLPRLAGTYRDLLRCRLGRCLAKARRGSIPWRCAAAAPMAASRATCEMPPRYSPRLNAEIARWRLRGQGPRYSAGCISRAYLGHISGISRACLAGGGGECGPRREPKSRDPRAGRAGRTVAPVAAADNAGKGTASIMFDVIMMSSNLGIQSRRISRRYLAPC